MNGAKTYEGMFLVDAGEDFQKASAPVREVLERSEADVLAIKPWDERRLAYEIQGRRRALYVLTYFRLDPQQVSEVERDSKLNDGIIRSMIFRKDSLDESELQADTPATASSSAGPEGSEQTGGERGARPEQPADKAEQPTVTKEQAQGEKATPDEDQPAPDTEAHPSKPSEGEDKGAEPEVKKEQTQRAEATPDEDQPAPGTEAHPSKEASEDEQK
ncbi:MAG: 30S ribosomal protein S6 [Planctomycetota bacterium]